ncbi:hypothetical protein ABPG72_000092 [Tetrahymena utriculariae]
MQQKTLLQILQQNIEIDCLQKFQLFKNICSQINLFHSQNKAYKYLCPQNIFVDGDMNVTLRVLNDGQNVQSEDIDWLFSSPELQISFKDSHNCSITQKTDIWSIGLLLNVVFTLKNLICMRGRIGFSKNSEYFFEIVPICMKIKPEDRPSCFELVSFLEDYENKYLKMHLDDMKQAHESFKRERQISSTIKIQKLDLIEDDDELEIRGNNIELEDLKLEYKNFSFHAKSKNSNKHLYLQIQDKPLKLNQNKIIKVNDYEIQVTNLDNQEGLITLNTTQENVSFENSFKIQNGKYITIGPDQDDQIHLFGLNNYCSLKIEQLVDGFYVVQQSNLSDSSSSLSSTDSARVYLKLEHDTPIQNQTIICSETQRYFVKQIC